MRANPQKKGQRQIHAKVHLLNWVLQRIDRILRDFLWNRADCNTSKVHLLNWATITLPTEVGGLGVTDLYTQNIALLLRWWWRLYKGNDSIWAEMVRKIYGSHLQNRGPLILNRTGSFFWEMLQSLKPIFQVFTRWEFGSGESISFWDDSWAGPSVTLSSGYWHQPRQRHISLRAASTQVFSILPAPFTESQQQAVSLLQNLTLNDNADVLLWWPETSRSFSVRSTYRLMKIAGKVSSSYTEIWKAKVPPSVRLLFDLFIKNKILTQEVMARRHFQFEPVCSLCGSSQLETTMHLFFQCNYSQLVWSMVFQLLGMNVPTIADSTIASYQASARVISSNVRMKWLVSFITVIWSIWCERNGRIFRNESLPVRVLGERILNNIKLYLKFC